MASNDSNNLSVAAELRGAGAAPAPAPAAAPAAPTSPSASTQKHTFYANHGEIHFQTQQSKSPSIVFHNPRAKKTDISCFPSTFRNLVNNLPVAQDVALKFIKAKESYNHDEAMSNFEADYTMPFKDQLTNSAMAAAAKDQSLIYYKELADYGEEIKMKLVLTVNVYKHKTNIWLKPMWKNPKAEEGTNPWFPTLRGFQFSIYDDADEIMSFIDRHHSAWAAAQHAKNKISADAAAAAAAAATATATAAAAT